MRQRTKHYWQKLPRSARRPIVLCAGIMLILLSGLIGWMPGPAGWVPFLLGIAVLSSEFAWAERFADTLKRVGTTAKASYRDYRAHTIVATGTLLAIFWSCIVLMFYKT